MMPEEEPVAKKYTKSILSHSLSAKEDRKKWLK